MRDASALDKIVLVENGKDSADESVRDLSEKYTKLFKGSLM